MDTFLSFLNVPPPKKKRKAGVFPGFSFNKKFNEDSTTFIDKPNDNGAGSLEIVFAIKKEKAILRHTIIAFVLKSHYVRSLVKMWIGHLISFELWKIFFFPFYKPISGHLENYPRIFIDFSMIITWNEKCTN